MTEDILKNKPGGERIMDAYVRTKSLTDSRRRDMVKILVAQITSEHGTSSSRRVKEDYAKGIIALIPYLADPGSKFGYDGTVTCPPFWSLSTFCHRHLMAPRDQEKSQPDTPVTTL
ncbi:uncharacterized protein ACWYII_015317 [Salvelinus alpinus]